MATDCVYLHWMHAMPWVWGSSVISQDDLPYFYCQLMHFISRKPRRLSELATVVKVSGAHNLSALRPALFMAYV